MSDVPQEADVPIAHRSINQRLGLILFAIYFAFYVGFIAITVYDYKILSKEVFGGMNLAIAYGMFLILLAIGLAILYAWMAKSDPEPPTEAAEI